MANEFIARNGLIAQSNSTITGTLTVTQGITGSLFGTASYATNALTSSFVTPLNQNVIITGSLLIGTGSSDEIVSYGLIPNLVVGMNTGSSGAVLDLRNTLGTSPAGSTLGAIQFSSYTTSGNYIASPAGIRATTTTQASTGNNGGGNIAFWTANIGYGDYQSERMRVNSNGQVLIGLTSSLDTTSKLIVSGSTTITGSLQVTQGITGSLYGTASWAQNALTASVSNKTYITANPNQGGNYLISSKTNTDNDYEILDKLTGLEYSGDNETLTITNGTGTFIGQLTGTASYATNALTASYVIGGTTLTTQDEGSTLSTTVTTLNFIGAGVVASGTGDTTTVTIAGGGGSGGTSLGLVQAFSIGLQNIF